MIDDRHMHAHMHAYILIYIHTDVQTRTDRWRSICDNLAPELYSDYVLEIRTKQRACFA